MLPRYLCKSRCNSVQLTQRIACALRVIQVIDGSIDNLQYNVSSDVCYCVAAVVLLVLCCCCCVAPAVLLLLCCCCCVAAAVLLLLLCCCCAATAAVLCCAVPATGSNHSSLLWAVSLLVNCLWVAEGCSLCLCRSLCIRCCYCTCLSL